LVAKLDNVILTLLSRLERTMRKTYEKPSVKKAALLVRTVAALGITCDPGFVKVGSDCVAEASPAE
jgi:hypothetical protein